MEGNIRFSARPLSLMEWPQYWAKHYLLQTQNNFQASTEILILSQIIYERGTGNFALSRITIYPNKTKDWLWHLTIYLSDKDNLRLMVLFQYDIGYWRLLVWTCSCTFPSLRNRYGHPVFLIMSNWYLVSMSQKVCAFTGCHERFDMASICPTMRPFPDYANHKDILCSLTPSSLLNMFCCSNSFTIKSFDS